VIASNGGAAALFAYLVCAFLVSWPLFLYELIIGQSIRLSTIRCYEMIRPRWKSLGYASGTMLFFVLSYYAQIVAYTLPYIIDSCKDPLPWVENGAEKHWFEDILDGYGPDEEKEGLGGIVPSLAISLFCFWIITLLSASFGSEILSKITYVTVCKYALWTTPKCTFEFWLNHFHLIFASHTLYSCTKCFSCAFAYT
jgi:SNF family Na+-dependent transporter